jgi:hypothetical protein
MRAVKKQGRMAVGRRSGRRRAATLNCPTCARAFVIAPGFIMDVVATGRIEPSGRAERESPGAGRVQERRAIWLGRRG